jgi:adenosyl cobinamide kinase/adenosyl cobinamide phosphate guanylyltransferase
MATLGERLVRVEQRCDQMWEWINGGPSTTHDESARARLHAVITALNTADKLADLLKEVREERQRQWSTFQKRVALAAAIAAAAAPYVLYFATR